MVGAILAADYATTAVVTVGYLSVYYLFGLRQLAAKRRARRECEKRGESFDRYRSTDRQFLAAERTTLNMLEHMPPFLVLLWLHAFFVAPVSASVAGGVYTLTRCAYPFLLGPTMPPRLPARLLIATYCGYVIQLYLAVGILNAAIAG